MIEPDRKEQIPDHSRGDPENRWADAYTTAVFTDPLSARRGRCGSGDHGGRHRRAGGVDGIPGVTRGSGRKHDCDR